MLDNIFGTILTNGQFTGEAFLEATACSLLIGLFIAGMYMIKNSYSKSFVITMALLPATVQMVIMLVNGNIGAGVAVAGAFSLVRFRSAPGKGQEITSIFLAMTVGLATGMGYIGVAACFAVIVSTANLILNVVNFGGRSEEERVLKITVPEDLDFEGKFEDIFDRYFMKYTVEEVKTTNMGSMYKLLYRVNMKKGESVKALMDEIRERNGNLEVSLNRPTVKADEL
ncbi:MAG: DUF4956 domain-containing protein [Eubacterium sp.]|nr:DUF4956 domain-containing protein [Eubacterium sp.]